MRSGEPGKREPEAIAELSGPGSRVFGDSGAGLRSGGGGECFFGWPLRVGGERESSKKSEEERRRFSSKSPADRGMVCGP